MEKNGAGSGVISRYFLAFYQFPLADNSSSPLSTLFFPPPLSFEIPGSTRGWKDGRIPWIHRGGFVDQIRSNSFRPRDIYGRPSVKFDELTFSAFEYLSNAFNHGTWRRKACVTLGILNLNRPEMSQWYYAGDYDVTAAKKCYCSFFLEINFPFSSSSLWIEIFCVFFFCEDRNCLFRVKFCVYYFLRYFDALIRCLIFEISFRGFEIGQKARRIKWKLRYLARFCRDRSLPRIAPRSPIWKWKERDIVRSVGLAGERMIFKRNLSRRFYKTFVKIFDENYLKFISNTF